MALGTSGMPVILGSGADATDPADPALASYDARARAAAGDAAAALQLAREIGREAPYPGKDTGRVWSLLATLGAADLTVARAVEPHLDALAILDQAGLPADTESTWGVFAAEGPPPPLRATPEAEGWRLDGVKPWCSLAGRLDRALITATGPEGRGLYAVDLHHRGVRAEPGTWVSRGLAAIDSGPLRLDGVPAQPVGGPGWYLARPGFAWGGIGVAAVWYGGAVGVARRLRRGRPGGSPDQLALTHLGAADALLHAARSVLTEAAEAVDRGALTGDDGAVAALRVRHVVATAAEGVLEHAAHAMGPGPLTGEEEHARRVADLQVYLRQWHAERDLARLGEHLHEQAEEQADEQAGEGARER